MRNVVSVTATCLPRLRPKVKTNRTFCSTAASGNYVKTNVCVILAGDTNFP